MEINPNKIVPIMQRRFGGEGATGFEVFAPQAVREHPDVLQAEDSRDRLAGTAWLVRCHDGYATTLTFDELLMLVLNVAAVTDSIERASNHPGGVPGQVQVSVDFSSEQLTPDKVKMLLGLVKIKIPSRGDA